MRQATARLLLAAGLLAAGPAHGKPRPRRPATSEPTGCGMPLPFTPLQDPGLELIFTPPDSVASPGKSDPGSQGHARWITALESAHDSVRMTMFHLTDPAVITALADAARTIAANHPGADSANLDVGVHVLLDHTFYGEPKNAANLARLKAAGVDVRPASSTFSITHEKAMVIDGTTAFITAMNMTTNESWTRDFGVVTHDAGVIGEVSAVFQADWQNYLAAKPAAPFTPALSASALLWSPVNAESKLVALINSAKPGTQLLCSTESLTDKAIEAALAHAARCGVRVEFLAPQCDENPDPSLNLSPLAALNEAAGTTIALAAPGPGSPQIPYIHSKLCLANFDPATGKGGTAYVGSVNFSTESTKTARELGVIFQDDAASAVISSLFRQDYAKGVSPILPSQCPPPAAAAPVKPEDPDGCVAGEICGATPRKPEPPAPSLAGSAGAVGEADSVGGVKGAGGTAR